MPTPSTDNKPKVFVRYAIGSSGLFISSLLMSFVKPVKLRGTTKADGHDNAEDFFRYNNFIEQWRTLKSEFNENTHGMMGAAKLAGSIDWIQNNFFFYESPWDIHVVPTHATNPDPLMAAYSNSKLVCIKTQESDIEQIGYNWITKAVSRFKDNQVALQNFAKSFKEAYPSKLPTLDLDNLQNEDIKKLTYIFTFAYGKRGITSFNNYDLSVSIPQAYNINFADIASKGIINKLDELAEFVGVTLTNERRWNAIHLINEYADAQVSVPWQFSIHDY